MTTDATFTADVLEQDKLVLVDFWAEWCPPCRMIDPVLKEIAWERAESLTVRKINTDENPETARKYQIMSLPTLMLFRDGEPVRSIVGARPKARLLADIDSVLESAVAR
ncbi:thioredoxin [Amycolatopsis sp. FDAARGOS 1241]|uniref:thioredoxin n=1 Tax=Amycolatopsis sp. FDAARGOS 1241 TaxID=2778070 RepID=UPI0019507145|nr:thioredoxin [Amycolatopsis sp. FDAARGOS 1241]QRP47640.1 thioredoxin [Amycolatopsis sp. FDAARGOS 1241]